MYMTVINYIKLVQKRNTFKNYKKSAKKLSGLSGYKKT